MRKRRVEERRVEERRVEKRLRERRESHQTRRPVKTIAPVSKAMRSAVVALVVFPISAEGIERWRIHAAREEGLKDVSARRSVIQPAAAMLAMRALAMRKDL